MAEQSNHIIQLSTAQRCVIFTEKGSLRMKGPSVPPGMDGVLQCEANPDACVQDVNQRD